MNPLLFFVGRWELAADLFFSVLVRVLFVLCCECFRLCVFCSWPQGMPPEGKVEPGRTKYKLQGGGFFARKEGGGVRGVGWLGEGGGWVEIALDFFSLRCR